MTGIKESDWSGRFWVRWSDAIREAGLASREMVDSYPDEVLVEKVALLARELGHYPVQAELLMKRRNDAAFPSEKVFRRFGGKAALVERVRSYCNDRSGFEDVAALCPAAIGGSAKSVPEPLEPQDFGAVYLMRSGKFYKLGRSNSVGRRHYELGIQLPEKLQVVHEIRTDDPQGIESYWHTRFEPKRQNGEWFDLDTSDVKAFKRRRFM